MVWVCSVLFLWTLGSPGMEKAQTASGCSGDVGYVDVDDDNIDDEEVVCITVEPLLTQLNLHSVR